MSRAETFGKKSKPGRSLVCQLAVWPKLFEFDKMKEPLQKSIKDDQGLLLYVRKKSDERFWGQTTLSWENGRIVNVKETTNIKPKDLFERLSNR